MLTATIFFTIVCLLLCINATYRLHVSFTLVGQSGSEGVGSRSVKATMGILTDGFIPLAAIGRYYRVLFESGSMMALILRSSAAICYHSRILATVQSCCLWGIIMVKVLPLQLGLDLREFRGGADLVIFV